MYFTADSPLEKVWRKRLNRSQPHAFRGIPQRIAHFAPPHPRPRPQRPWASSFSKEPHHVRTSYRDTTLDRRPFVCIRIRPPLPRIGPHPGAYHLPASRTRVAVVSPVRPPSAPFSKSAVAGSPAVKVNFCPWILRGQSLHRMFRNFGKCCNFPRNRRRVWYG